MRAVLLVGCLIIVSTSHRSDVDLWGHLRFGQDVLATRTLPATATHTYTAVGYPWVNHENLAEIVLAWIAIHFGVLGLTAFSTLLSLLVLVLMERNATRQAVSFPVRSLVILLATCAMGPGWALRPQVFTYTFFALLLVILERSFRDLERPAARFLWLAPPLFVLWVNAHGGFLAGLAVLALYLGCHATVALWRRRRDALGEVGTYVLVLAGCALATLVNPYGLRLLTWIAAAWTPPRPEISEWHALVPPDPWFFILAMLVGLWVVAWVCGGRRDPGQLAVVAATAWQSVVHARHLPFLGLLAGFWLPAPVEALWARRRRGARDPAPPPSPRAVRLLARASTATAVLLLATLLLQSRALWVKRSEYPVDAIQFMADRHLAGKLVVHFDWAQYALAALAPETRVAFDGRLRTCYPQSVADLYFDFLLGNQTAIRWRRPTSPPLDDTAILRLREPDLSLASRHFKHGLKVMRRSGWVLLYRDGLAELWGRPDRYGDPASPDYVPPAARTIRSALPRGYVRWPAFPVRREPGSGPAGASAADVRSGGVAQQVVAGHRDHRDRELEAWAKPRAQDAGERLRDDGRRPDGRDAAAPQRLIVPFRVQEGGREDEEAEVVERDVWADEDAAPDGRREPAVQGAGVVGRLEGADRQYHDSRGEQGEPGGEGEVTWQQQHEEAVERVHLPGRKGGIGEHGREGRGQADVRVRGGEAHAERHENEGRPRGGHAEERRPAALEGEEQGEHEHELGFVEEEAEDEARDAIPPLAEEREHRGENEEREEAVLTVRDRREDRHEGKRPEHGKRPARLGLRPAQQPQAARHEEQPEPVPQRECHGVRERRERYEGKRVGRRGDAGVQAGPFLRHRQLVLDPRL